MTSQQLSSFYSERKSNFSTELTAVKQRINLISNIRIATALIFIAAVYYGFTYHTILYLLPVILFVFILLVQHHGKLFSKRTHLQNLVRINECELQSLKGDVSCYETGSEFSDPHHPYAHDLDIFGEGSLFQYSNRCNTLTGKKEFAYRLTHPFTTATEIIERQKAVEELSSRVDFRQHIQASGMEIDEQTKDKTQLLEWLKQPAFLYGKSFYQYFLIAIPVITIALLIGWSFNTVFRPFALLMAAFQWGFLGLHIKKVNAFYEYVSRKKNILQKYATLLHYLQDEKFSSPQMTSLFQRAENADLKVKQLASLVHAFDARANAMTTIFTNSLLLFDLQCVYRLEKWKEENKSNLEMWLQAVSEAEVLCSMGTFAFNNARFIFPKITDQLSITATALAHPLIPAEECVVNDLRMASDQQILIITGANMAGKSTFLRTIGVNLILALNGSPVCATEFSCPIIQLRTGMRTADSLKDHQSYFYAELDRLKGIMDELRKDIPLLILLDEILKGTNSTDKQAGSIALVRQLLPHPCLGIIATHDLALGDLEKEYPNKIRNYCFEANIENDQLSFDYKLKPGLAQKMNATFLMKKMGIIPS
jgi:hypothetical protein